MGQRSHAFIFSAWIWMLLFLSRWCLYSQSWRFMPKPQLYDSHWKRKSEFLMGQKLFTELQCKRHLLYGFYTIEKSRIRLGIELIQIQNRRPELSCQLHAFSWIWIQKLLFKIQKTLTQKLVPRLMLEPDKGSSQFSLILFKWLMSSSLLSIPQISE